MSVSSSPRLGQLERFIARLGLTESEEIRWDLMELALTHPSASNTANYEQLEFVGDAVVRLVSANLLWMANAEGTVGEWSAIRSALVSDRTLAEIALSLGLDRFLVVGASAIHDRKGETSRLADSFEAVLGALFLSTRTLDLIQPWLEPLFQRYAEKIRSDPTYQNYKAALQQWTQSHHKILPEYRVQPISPSETQMMRGQEFSPQFEAEVWLLGQRLGRGQGRSMKAAEKAAAQQAYLTLTQSENGEN